MPRIPGIASHPAQALACAASGRNWFPIGPEVVSGVEISRRLRNPLEEFSLQSAR